MAGDIAIDGTAGKGRDTAFLAQAVGPSGHVHSFDIQPEAIASTDNLCTLAGLSARVTLHHRSHADIAVALPAAHLGKVGAAIFNLGYLPGGNPDIITQPQSTATALRSAYAALRAGGRLICVAYTGHPGGMEESDVVLAFAAERTTVGDTVEKIGHVPNPGKPWVLSVTKR
jgi:16S rRNA C1402 N4-methylase RsmH